MGKWWLVGCLISTYAIAQDEPKVAPRRSNAADLTPKFERYVTRNGLVVLLSPDAAANSVVVDLSFAAGALYQPPGKAGLAHLVEHVFSSGSTPETDYQAMLEQHGGLGFNALTTLDRMSFRVRVPPEELPLALWTNADRFGAMAPTITEDDLAKHKRVVAQERVHRVDDAPYGGNAVATMRSLFPEGHPLRLGVIGARDDINSHTLEEVKEFQRTLLVPANGVLTLCGKFEPAAAKEWIDKTLSTLPAGRKALPPVMTPARTPEVKVSVAEELGRRPRMTLAWTLDRPITELAEALEFGSLFLTIYTDGFVGMNVSSSLIQYDGGAVFLVEVTMQHAADRGEAAGNAEAVFRYLSRVVMPKDLVAATLLAWDRGVMEQLASNDARATMLTQNEVHPRDELHGMALGERHWAINPVKIKDVANAALGGKRVEVLSRPTRPLPRKAVLQ